MRRSRDTAIAMKSGETDFAVKGVPVVFCALFHGQAVSVFPARGGKDIGETMSYNHEKAEMAFREEWQKTVRMMLDAGMPKKKIRRFYEFEREQFNRERKIREKEESGDIELISDFAKPCQDEYFSEPDDWQQNIEDDSLYIGITLLTKKQKALVSKIYVEGYDIKSISIRDGITVRAVNRMNERALKKLKEKNK